MARSRCGQRMRSPRSFWGWQDPGVGAMWVRGGQGREVWGLAGGCLAGCRGSVRGAAGAGGWWPAASRGAVLQALGCGQRVRGGRGVSEGGHGLAEGTWQERVDAGRRCGLALPSSRGSLDAVGGGCDGTARVCLFPVAPILGRARGGWGHPAVGTGAGEPRLGPRTRPLGRDVPDWGLGQFWGCGTAPSGHALWGSDSGGRAVPREGGSPHRHCPEDVPAGRAWHPPPRQGTVPGVPLSPPQPPATPGRHRPPCPCLSPSSRCPHPGGLGAASSRGGHRGWLGQGGDRPPPPS